MKKIPFLVVVALAFLPVRAFAQDDSDSTGLPGDNFDLAGAMELFRNSSTLEDFEKALNSEKNGVNNLDLNGDKAIDYVKVIDKVDGKSHAILMQVPVNATEKQDVAAILVEKTGDSVARLQIVGNELLYGEEKIMEPYAEVADKPTTGPAELMSPTHSVFVNVYYWPCVNYMYYPSYVVYASPWGWEYYPVWWSPWEPYYWNYHYNRVRWYHSMYYHQTNVCYVNHAHNVYKQHRSESRAVKETYAAPRAEYVERKTQRGASPSRTTTAPVGRTTVPGRVNPGTVEKARNPSTSPAPSTKTPETPRPTTTAPVPQQRVPEQQRPQPTAPQRVPERERTAPVPQQRAPERQVSPQRQPQPAARPQQRQSAPVSRPVPSRSTSPAGRGR